LDATRRSALGRLGLDRLLIVASLGLLSLVAWAYLAYLSAAMARGDMSLMGLGAMPAGGADVSGAGASMSGAGAAVPGAGAAMTGTMSWTPTTVVLMFAMWFVMMIGMMIPSALPAILLYSRVQHHYRSAGAAARYSGAFVCGYLLAWAGFSLLATVIQWGLNSAGLLSPMTMSVSAGVGAVLFAAAGLYQLSPLKDACLRHCRSPAEFLSSHRRAGWQGALLTGVHHGIYCVGCCWLLMALLFAVGVMNLLWVAVLAVFVLLEKLVPFGHWLGRLGGIGMLLVAAYLVWAR
jgi:predicted metal-binding membrane protein